MTSTFEQRRAFVDHCRSTERIAFLDGTRDTYRTVVVATLSANTAESIQETADDAGYTLATTWTTTLFQIYVFSTTPEDLPTLLSTSDPPPYLVENALEYFSDTSHTR
jgi:hypothetical protein